MFRNLLAVVVDSSRFQHSRLCVRGMKFFKPPEDYSDVVIPDRTRLSVVPKVPQLSGNVKPYKSPKKLIDIRGPELTHNELLHKQYGIIALGGGRMRFAHFEVIRLGLGRIINKRRMFLTWRVPAPWKSVTKKGQGKRMGGGKGSIHHYVSPVKAGRVIVELAGHCEYEEVRHELSVIASKMPFKAIAVSQQLLLQNDEIKEWRKKKNENSLTYEYCIRNNIQNCHHWCSPYDKIWFGEYL